MREIIIKTLKGSRVRKATLSRKMLYETQASRVSIARFQTDRFNDIWHNALLESPFYRMWAEHHSLPSQISDIRELSDFPVLKKQNLVEHANLLTESQSDSFYLSGGSTGKPTKFPKNHSETILRYANHVVTQSWLGLRPGERYVHIWGHAHLFGRGKQASVHKVLRKSKDWLVGGHRLSAYNQSSADIKEWIATIERVRPKYLVGYASALVNLAAEIENTVGTLRIPRLEWLVSTAETILPEDIERLRRVFGVPVAIEYGAIETGLIAHSRPAVSDKLHVLWASIAANVNTTGSLRISTLDPRLFPLINYEIGDRVEGCDETKQVLSFQSILGRTSEQLALRLRNGTLGRISMIGVVGSLKHIDGIRTVQAAQIGTDAAEIYVTGPLDPDPQKMKLHLLRELSITGVDVDPSALTFKTLKEPVRSVAGKTGMLVPKIAP